MFTSTVERQVKIRGTITKIMPDLARDLRVIVLQKSGAFVCLSIVCKVHICAYFKTIYKALVATE